MIKWGGAAYIEFGLHALFISIAALIMYTFFGVGGVLGLFAGFFCITQMNMARLIIAHKSNSAHDADQK